MLETANNNAVDANTSQRNSAVPLAMPDQDTAAFVYPKNTFVTTDLNSCDALVTSGLSLPDPENIISTLRWQMEGATNAQSPGSGVNQLSSYVFNKGTTRITYQGTTRNNNPIYCTFTLTVRDNQAPRLVFSPGNITVSNSTGKCYARVNWTEPIVTDNCVATENLISKSNYKPGDEFPVGETNVEYRISDGLNETIHSFLVTVVDREAPELTAPETIVVVCGEEVEDAFTSWKQFEQAGGKVSDNCAVDFESFRYVRQIASAIRCPYTITRTYSIADVSGNVTEVKHVIKVLGESMVSETKEKAEESQLLLKAGAVNQAEIAFLKTDVTCKGGNDGTVKLIVSGTSGALSYVWLTSNGNGIVQGRKDQTTLSDGEYTVRIFEDGDLLLEFDFSILVSDNEAPHITAPENITLDCGQTIPAAYSIWSEFANAGGAVWDNCRIYYSSFRLASESKSNPDCPYTLTRTYEITDINGNRGYAEHLITVEAGEVVLKSGAGTAGTITARATGDWNLASTWDCNCVPDFEDDVIIPSGFTVTVDAAAECNNITIETGGTLDHSGATTLQVYGNWTNNGIYSSGSGTIEFTGSADAVIGGSSTTSFNNFILNKGSDVSSSLEINSVGAVSLGSYTFSSGLLVLSTGSYTLSDAFDLPQKGGIHVNGATLNTGDFTIGNQGLIQVSSGTANFGNSAGNSIETSTDGAFIVSGGTVNIAGRLHNSAGGTLATGIPSGINISGGTINLATVGNGLSSTGALNVTQQGAFDFAAGTINIIHANSTSGTAIDLGIAEVSGDGTKAITNGVFHFGDGTANTYQIISAIDLPNITTANNAELEITRTISTNGTYSFILADGAGNEIPVEITISATSYSSNASIKVTTTDGKFADNLSSSNYLSRYWTVELTGITYPVYNISADYRPADIVGTESEIKAGAWNETGWIKGDVAEGNTVTFNGLTGDLNISGITADDPTVIAGAVQNTVCTGDAINLTSNPTGDAPFTYAWTGPNSFSSTDQNPTRSNATTADAGDYKVIATDGNGFIANATVTITVNTPPTFTTCQTTDILANTIVGTCAANVNYTVAATGTPAPDLTYSFSGETIGSGNGTGSGSSFNLGTTTVTVTAINVCGSVDCSFDITVTDNENPTISCVANRSKDSDAGTCNYTVVGTEFDPTATGDNCGIASVLNDFNSGSTLAGAVFPLGTTTVVWTITDNASNTATCTFDVTVVDDQDPVITCPTVLASYDTDAGECYSTQSFVATATDNCSVSDIKYYIGATEITFPYQFPVGTTTVRAEATDTNSRTIDCTFDVAVVDDQDPVITCPTVLASYDTDAGECYSTQSFVATATDNCSVSDIKYYIGATEITFPYQFPVGTTTVRAEATDTNSRTIDCTFDVTVIDDQDPTPICKPLTIQLDATGNASITTSDIDNGSTDNCTEEANLVFALDKTDFTCDDVGSNTVTLTVTDEHGNSNTCFATVEIVDDINPTASCREITIQLNSSGTAVIAASDIDYGSSDNCSIKSVTIDKTIFSCEDVGTNTVTLTVTDASGNSSTCEGTVTVEDKTKPIAICKNFTVQLDETGNASITAADIDNGSYDACGIASRDLDRYDFTCADLGTNAVTLTVTDNNGNPSSCPAVVTVTDNLPPTASAGGSATICIDETHTVSGANANNGTIEWTHDGNGTLTNSNSLSPSYTSVLADAGNTVTLTLTVTGNNACGNNTATASYLVDVNPVATVNPIAAMEYCEGETTPAVALSSNLGAAVTFNITGGQDIGLFNKNNVTEIPSFTANAGTRIVTITPVYNGCPGEPLNVEITVNPTPSVSASPLFQTICSGEETAILLGSNLAGSTFNWTATVDPAGSVSGVADGVNESTNTITQTLVNNTFSEATVTYRIYAENGDCPGAAMDIVVKVKPGLTAGIEKDTIVCQEDQEPNITFTVNGGTAPYIFTYTINDGANQDVELNAGNTIDVPVPTDTDGDFTYKLVSVYEAGGCTHLFNETATVTVSPKPYLSSTLTPTGVCSNNAFAYTPASATTGTTFSWSRAAIAGIDNPAETGTDAIDEYLINTTKAPIPVVYTYTLEADGCTNTQDVVVMVTPAPSLTSTLNPDGVCSESLFSYTPTSDVSETTFPWTRAAVAGISNPAASGTGDINEVLVNTTDNPVAVTYEYTLTSNDCVNPATYPVVVVVTPAPEVTASVDVNCVCPGGTFNLYSSSDISGGTPLPGTLLSEDFNGSASGWRTTNNSSGGDPAAAAWTLRPEGYRYSAYWGEVRFSSNDDSQFYLSNSDDQEWWSDYTRTTLESPAFSTVGYNSLELDFYHYYEDNGGDYANIEVSTDGANWTQVQQFNSDRGSSTNFRHETIDLTAYIGQPTLYIRFRYYATYDYFWAIDNVTVTGTSTGTAVDVSWESIPAGFTSNVANPTNVTITDTTQFVVTYVDPDTNCPGRDTVFVDICETPDPVIAPDYCAYEGRVLLTAYGGADGASYSWVDSNGDVVGTDKELIVDIVDVYTLTITNPNGCSATTQLTVSNELIINGDFEAGNTGFSSDYGFVEPYLNNPPSDAPRDGTPWSSLWPEGLYGVGTNARHYHTNFWGRQDHTSGSGYFMIVNGNVNAGTPIWEQTVNVQPNTNYYFSAWAMSLNSAGNDAVLQFEVNGVLVGSLARLNRGVGDNSNNGWVRFYSEPNWNSGNVSGPITVRIRNVEPAAGGNDFALDDISFGTFDPFPLEIDVAFDDVCEGDTLFLYSNSQYGKEPITYSWTGPNGWTSNEPNPFIPNFSSANAGKYKLEALDGYGCEILPDSTTVPFNEAPIANAGPDDFVCTANPVVNLNGTIGGSATSGYWTGSGGTFNPDANTLNATYTLSQAEIDAGIAELILSTDDPTGVCEAHKDTLYITIHNSLEITTSSTIPDCHGWATGTATATVSVTTVEPYTYLWSDGQTTPIANNLSAGTYTVTVTDANGCTASEEVIVDEPDLFVISKISPIIAAPSCYGANDGSATMEVTGGTPPYTFIWDAATGDQRTATASNLAAGTYTVLVTDANGCSAATFTATIPNPPPPTLNCPDDVEDFVDPASCAITFSNIEEPLMDGFCTTTLTYELSGATTGSGTGSVNGQVDFNVGLTTVKYKIEDTAGNKDSCTFTVLAKHLELDPTVYSCPPATVNAGAPDTYVCYKTVALDKVELDDQCNEIESIWHDSPYSSDPSDASGDYPVGTTNFSWYIRDVSGNIKTCDVTVIVDDLGPQITCPADVSEEIAANECSKTGVTIDPPEYRDNCPNAELSYVLSGATTGSGMGVVPSYQVFNIGVTTVTYTVTDVNNNTAECSFTVTIERLSIPPAVIICPDSPDPVTAVAGTCFAPVTVDAPVINDPCATTNYTIINDFNHTDDASDSYPVGTTTVNWTITDNSGKTYTCVQEVIVEDLPPTIDCPDDYTFFADENVDYKDNVTLDDPTYADNCPDPIVEWTRVEPDGTTTQSGSTGINFIPNPGRYYVGVTTITYKITDSSGLTDDCSFTVTVTGPPDITCPPVYETTTDPGVCTATRSSDDYGLPTLDEGVQPITWIWTIYNPDGTVGATNSATPFVGSAANPGPPAIPDYPFETGTSTIHWYVKNISGFDECSYEVIVTDKEPPTLDADPYEDCVDPLHWAVYNPSNPNPVFNHTDPNLEKFPVDYRTLYAEDTSLDLTSLKDNCCDSTEMTIHWRIEFSDTPDPNDGTSISHDAISGTGQPSTYVHPTTDVPTDIYLWGDGVTFQPVEHRIYYWVIDCNGNQSETVEKTITILPRPQIIKMNY
ncbi:HYR domain-containing protein [Draconibacterium orientale]|nr:HYR domain-containing protein [Draconibacterium orientale]